MSSYNTGGTAVQTLCLKNGLKIAEAYDTDGEQVFSLGLKVMEYNVGGWYDGSGSNVPAAHINTYYNLQAETIMDNDPDVLLINEYLSSFSDTGYSALSFLQQFFPYVQTVSSGTYYGRAICSKYPLSNYQSNLYLGDANRYYDTMTMTVGNKIITLCVTHFGLTVEARQAETTELITFLQLLQTPFICAGDLNTAKSATTDSEDYVNVIQPMVDAGFHLANMGDLGRFITYKNTEKGNGALDNIVVSHDLIITSAAVSTEKEEADLPTEIDHMPLVAIVQL